MIDSKTNKTVSLVKKLANKKYRKQYGLYVIEGDKLIKDAFRLGKQIEMILATPSKTEQYSVYTQCVTVSDHIMEYLCDTVACQGVLAIVKTETVKGKIDGNCLILEHVQDPANVGSILRCAVATGYNNVFLVDCADVYAPKTVRCAMSAHFALAFYDGTLAEAVTLLRPTHTLLCADMNGINAFEYVAPQPHALLIGNEGNGVSQEAKDACSACISIPMKNNLESLNAAVSAGILMYQLTIGRKEYVRT